MGLEVRGMPCLAGRGPVAAVPCVLCEGKALSTSVKDLPLG